jgi:hypothetical protein
MTTMTVTTKITQRYLMNKTKHELCRFVDMVLDTLEKERAYHRWTSVEDRVPEVGQRVIATDDLMMNVAIAWIASEKDAPKYWIWQGHIDRVRYWVPMPERDA